MTAGAPSRSKRRLLKGVGAMIGAAATSAVRAQDSGKVWDVIVIGGGNSGIPLAIFASRRGAKVLVIEAAAQVGGTLFLSSGQMSAGGTKFQKSKGIDDTPKEHFDDIMRISNGTANPEIVKLATDNAPETVDWLIDAGFKPRDEHPVMGSGHDPYSKKRYFWGAEGGISILKTLEKELAPEVAKGNVTLMLNTEATGLIQERPGAPVTGVITKGENNAVGRHLGRNIVLTCGGYGSNSKMFEELEGVRDYADTVYPYSQGAGITMGLAAGGYLRGKECHQPLFNAILADDNIPSPVLVRVTTNPEQRQPWEIWVNVRGERFIQEDTPSYDAKEKGLAAQPEERIWIVFDDAILKAAPSVSRSWDKQQITEAFGTYPMFYKANSLAELAAATGVDAAGLKATVDDYNRGQAGGKDKFGRTHMPLPIKQGPFYAIRMQGYYLLDTVGLGVDSSLRVLTSAGKPIPNLYAAGELIGMAAFQGRSYCGGMSVTPALTFGRILGHRILPLSS